MKIIKTTLNGSLVSSSLHKDSHLIQFTGDLQRNIKKCCKIIIHAESESTVEGIVQVTLVEANQWIKSLRGITDLGCVTR